MDDMLTALNLTRNTTLALRVQLAGDGPNRRRGLLGRESLHKDEGLWIIPCEAVHTFAMRFAIDLVYLDRHHRVVKTRSSVRPWRISACLRAHSVVELAAGVILETQTRQGDQLRLESTLENVYQADHHALHREQAWTRNILT